MLVAVGAGVIGGVGAEWKVDVGLIMLVGILASAYLLSGWMSRRNYRYATPSAPITSLNQMYNGIVSLIVAGFFVVMTTGMVRNLF